MAPMTTEALLFLRATTTLKSRCPTLYNTTPINGPLLINSSLVQSTVQYLKPFYPWYKALAMEMWKHVANFLSHLFRTVLTEHLSTWTFLHSKCYASVIWTCPLYFICISIPLLHLTCYIVAPLLVVIVRDIPIYLLYIVPHTVSNICI
jgi:hypothetical protein